jgi:hypothetical protein
MSADIPRSVMEEARRTWAKTGGAFFGKCDPVVVIAEALLARDKRAAEIAMAAIAKTEDEYQKEMAEAIAEAILTYDSTATRPTGEQQ